MKICNNKICNDCKQLEKKYQNLLKIVICKTKNGAHHSVNDRPAWVALINYKQDDEEKYECWYSHGELHRLHGPAIVCCSGDFQWFKNDQVHRENNEQAIEWEEMQIWAENSLAHRTDGPAIIEADGTKHWCIRGEEMTEDEFNKRKSNGLMLQV